MAVAKHYFSLYEIALMSLCGALVVALKTVFNIPLHLPGNSGIFWVVPVIIGAGIIKKPGSGCYIGLISGILASLFGLDALHVLDIFKYFALGAIVDLVGLLFLNRFDNPAVGFIAGAAGNLAKMVVNYLVQTFLGIPATFILIGMGIASVTHFIFGGIGGIIAALILSRLLKAGVITHDET
jgi:ABC-type thiamin/hydroxymethylpyrimidine transport system permease subunit